MEHIGRIEVYSLGDDVVTERWFNDTLEHWIVRGPKELEVYLSPENISTLSTCWNMDRVRVVRDSKRENIYHHYYRLGTGLEVVVYATDMPNDRMGVRATY